MATKEGIKTMIDDKHTSEINKIHKKNNINHLFKQSK